MKTLFRILMISILLFPQKSHAQVTLLSESFETDGEGTRYTSNSFNQCNIANPDYFLRGNTNPFLPPGTCATGHGSAVTLCGSCGTFFWGSEDIRSSTVSPPGALPPGFIQFNPINITNYNALQVSIYLATASNNNIRWENSDSINIQASINGGPFNTVGRFMGTAVAGGNLIIDANLNGSYDAGSEATPICDIATMTKYTFNIPGSGTNLVINLDFDQLGGTEELAIDLIEVKGTAVLPVSLLGFSGYKEGNHNQLQWTTISEQNCKEFELQRSSDGVNYTTLGFIKSQAPGGNSATPMNYAITDYNPNGGRQYYRIRMIDMDNRSKLSNIVLIKGDRPMLISFGEVFPNPASELVNVLIDAPGKNNLVMVVTDIAGRNILKQEVHVESGSNTIPININKLSSGTYIVKLICPDNHLDNCTAAVGKFVKK
jgi:hypothetical protein